MDEFRLVKRLDVVNGCSILVITIIVLELI